ncbi:hypothetical protein [Streptomyces sp. NPDC007088]|uniref:hypothetical protein n=1 Tax=Streptomyces sp. NPDC007088 TaxID=3364773 RepID=UPI0036B6AF75
MDDADLEQPDLGGPPLVRHVLLEPLQQVPVPDLPPCACARCREGEAAGDESVALRKPRERVNEENAWRCSIRRQG